MSREAFLWKLMHVCGHHVEDVLSFSYLFLQILNVVAVARHEVLNVEGKEQEKERSSASAPVNSGPAFPCLFIFVLAR